MKAKKRNCDGIASRERAMLSMTAIGGISFCLFSLLCVHRATTRGPLTDRKNEAPSQNHQSNVSYNGTRVLAICKIAHRTSGVVLHHGGFRLRRVGDCVHIHSHIHWFIAVWKRGREGCEKQSDSCHQCEMSSYRPHWKEDVLYCKK